MNRISILIFVLPIVISANTFEESVLDCDAGNAEACYSAGKFHSSHAYKNNNYDSSIAAAKVSSYYKKACNLGYIKGCTAYAMSYASDTNKDPEKNARYYFQKACDGGDDTGCTMLKMMPQ